MRYLENGRIDPDSLESEIEQDYQNALACQLQAEAQVDEAFRDAEGYREVAVEARQTARALAFENCVAQDHIQELASFLEEQGRKLNAFSSRKRTNLSVHRTTDPHVRQAVFEITGGCCTYCGRKLHFASFVVDHIVPAACGGPDHFKNYAPACSRCNDFKTDKHPLSFLSSSRAMQGEPVE